MASRQTLILAAAICISSSLIQSGHADFFLMPAGGNLVNQKLTLSRELLRQRRIEEARATLDKLLELEKDLPHREVILAQLLTEMGNSREARQVLESLSEAAPERFDASFAFCQLAVRESRWLEGCLLAQHTHRLTPPSSWSDKYKTDMLRELARLEGSCWKGRKNWQSALTVYRDAEKALGPSRGLLAAIARSEFYLGNIEQSREEMMRLREIDPKSDSPEVMLAQLFESQNDIQHAEAWYRQAIESREPCALAARLHFARFLIWNNRTNEVPSILAAKQPTEEAERERQYLAALVARMERRYDDAERILNALLANNPSQFAVVNQLALVLIESPEELNQLRALQLAKSNLRNHPKQTEAWATIGWVQFRLGDIAQSQQSLVNAARTGVVTRDTAYYIAALRDSIGQVAIAEELRTAISNAKGPFFYASQQND